MKRLALLSTLVAGAIAAGVAPASATSVQFNVVVNTTPLIGNASAPFYLDFLLIGGPTPSNTVTISDFGFSGGAPAGAATLSGPGVTGDLSSTVTLTDNVDFLNEFYQAFTPGATLGFEVTVTTNEGTTPPITPDAFSFAILDKNLINLPTTSPLFDDSLLFTNLTPGLVTSDLVTSSTTSPAGVTTTAAVVPEPATLVLFGTGLALTVRRRLKK